MHRTGYMSHHSFNTVIKNDIHARRLIAVTLNPKKIANSDVKCMSL
jgi:D-alanyl-D-alanine carboxypeptidase